MNFTTTLDSPIGPLRPVVDEQGRVKRIAFPDEILRDAEESDTRTAGVVSQLQEYFEGRRKVFDLELAADGSAFQHRVWRYVFAIPFGETRSYGQIAQALGLPNSSRAVGRANATNPIPIVVPCHRVIGTNGHLTGYAGGLDKKRRLLEFESPGLFSCS